MTRGTEEALFEPEENLSAHKALFYYCLQHNHQDLATKGSRYSAIAGYTAVENTEVSFQEGDSLELLRVGQEGWWFARHIENAKEGWVPASYLELQSP